MEDYLYQVLKAGDPEYVRDDVEKVPKYERCFKIITYLGEEVDRSRKLLTTPAHIKALGSKHTTGKLGDKECDLITRIARRLDHWTGNWTELPLTKSIDDLEKCFLKHLESIIRPAAAKPKRPAAAKRKPPHKRKSS